MSAMRLVFTRLCRRSLEIGQAIGSLTVPRTMLPPSSPTAARNLEGWQHLSTDGMMSADQKKQLLMKLKTVSALRLWLQRSSGPVKNAAEAYGSSPICGAIVSMASLCYLVWTFQSTHRNSLDSEYDESYADTMPYFMLPSFRVMHPNSFGGIYPTDEKKTKTNRSGLKQA